MKFREHRGSLIESMKTLVEFNDRSQLLDILKKTFGDYKIPKNLNNFKIKPYIYDERIDWDTHMVTLEGHGVLGFTDSPVDH